ncbi:hypothetical protein JCM6882_007982 [Rhodosporidiobolus microsporus]
MASTNQTQTALEGSLKATLVQLSHILAFQARLQQQGASQYALEPPRQLTDKLKVEADQLEGVCTAIEQRVLKALAVLERDARKAAGISPLPVPSPEPAPAAEPPKAAVETMTIDDEPLPFTLPVSTASSHVPSTAPSAPSTAMQLDLTLSPSPPPAALPDNAPLPFQLPVSTSSSSTPSAASVAAPAAASSAPAAAGAPAEEDINALLSSLNMPPFDPSTFLTSSAPLASSSASTSAAPPVPDLSLDQLDALFSSSTSSSASAAPITSAAPAFSAPLDLSSLGLTTSSAPSDPTGMGAFDYTSLINDAGMGNSTGGGAAGGAPGLGDLDLSTLGAGEFDFSQLGEPNLDELLKSLG